MDTCYIRLIYYLVVEIDKWSPSLMNKLYYTKDKRSCRSNGNQSAIKWTNYLLVYWTNIFLFHWTNKSASSMVRNCYTIDKRSPSLMDTQLAIKLTNYILDEGSGNSMDKQPDIFIKNYTDEV